MGTTQTLKIKLFQSTCPARGTTAVPKLTTSVKFISIHVPREGHDYLCADISIKFHVFQSTCPARGTTCRISVAVQHIEISIHVPREGHDEFQFLRNIATFSISIHVPREGHDFCVKCKCRYKRPFQSTCPARGTTLPGKTPYVARIISIHVPREGHDEQYDIRVIKRESFQSTCPARGTTIHVDMLESCDKYFNPRAPRGARPFGSGQHKKHPGISIHVPREGHDRHP